MNLVGVEADPVMDDKNLLSTLWFQGVEKPVILS